MSRIQVEQQGVVDGYTFEVEVHDDVGASRHTVKVDEEDYMRLGGDVPPDRFVEACFEFLLDREPKDQIMSRFEVRTINDHFPEFEDEIGTYL